MKSAVLAGLRTQETEESWAQKLHEAVLLCEACGIEVKTRLAQKAQKGHPRTLLGSGKVNELKQQKLELKISEDEFTKQLSEIKGGKDTPTVIIKATDDASYMNLIDALDEMQICNIGKYVITNIAEADEFLIKNYDSKGELSQNIAE